MVTNYIKYSVFESCRSTAASNTQAGLFKTPVVSTTGSLELYNVNSSSRLLFLRSDVTKFSIYGNQVSKCRRHVVGQVMFGMSSKILSTYSHAWAGIVTYEIQNTHCANTSTTTIYTNVVYDSLSYKMASATLTVESNSKWRHCHLIIVMIFSGGVCLLLFSFAC